MAKDEVLSGNTFYLNIEGMDNLIVKKVSGLSIKFSTAGDEKSYGVTKGGKSYMQATVAGVESAVITVEFVASQEDQSMHDWYRASHAVSGPFAGGGAPSGGLRKSASLIVYNQAADAEGAAQWNFVGVFPKSYKTTKMEPGSTELFTEKVEFAYETCHRVK